MDVFLHSDRAEVSMADVFVTFTETVADEDGREFMAKACGTEAPGGLWQGWIEFTPIDGGTTLRSGRETTQPNRQDLAYWATGLTGVYLEGALHRAMTPRTAPAPVPEPVPAYDGPAPDRVADAAASTSVLNPFSVYRKGETLLRRQLAALSDWHLVNIIRHHALSDQPAPALARLNSQELIELIVAGVRLGADEPVNS
jgi:hypothetical protein